MSVFKFQTVMTHLTNSKKNVCFLFFLFTIPFYGQENLSYKSNKITPDTTYIKNLADKLIVKIFVDNKTDTYTFFRKNPDEIYTITPNVNSKISVSLDYEIFAFALSVPKKWSPFKPDELKGNTKDISFSFGFFLNKWYQNFYFSNTRGYYIANTDGFIPEWQQGTHPYLQLPNYRARKFEGTTSYVLNANRFSYRSFLYQTQIQKKSAGSFIPTLNYLYLYHSDSDQESDYQYRENIFSMSAILAYQYNWVVSPHFCFSAGANIGVGFRNSNGRFKVDNDQATRHYTSLSNTLGFNANINYQNNRFFCGLKGIVSGTTANDDRESSVNNSILYGVVYFGYCFDTPHLISKVYNKIF